jgi:hypothetical protein
MSDSAASAALNTPAPGQNSPQPRPAASSGGGYSVKTPWHCSEFHVGDVVVTPKGVLNEDGEVTTVSKDQADDLTAQAKIVRMTLTVEEAKN